MRKIFLTLIMTVVAVAVSATDYTGTLTVTVNGESTNAESTISVVDNGSGSYTLSINNFVIDGLPVGNIVVTAPGTTTNGLTSIITSQTINITEGDNSQPFWLGPDLGDVPINMVLAFNNYAITTNIDIYMAELEQTINVKFAQDGELTGYQIKNSGFENFKNNGEPLAWHGFKSATGGLASSAKGTLASSTDVRSGATGTSAVITSGSTFGIVNNGTMTTGRLNASSMSATNTANHSEMTMSDSPVDANGDPYYTLMHGRPDAIKFWMKFTQGTPQGTYKYATMSAIITDGTYYQDPEDKNYTNKLATAKNNTIETCGWTEFNVPFNYIDENVNGQALLVTFSTNATPGKGSDGDQVFVDDIALVYNAAITGISIKGTDLEGFSQDVYEYNFELANGETFTDDDISATHVSEHAYLVKKAIQTEDGYKLFVAVVSNDLNTCKVYTINYTKTPTLSLIGTFNNWSTETAEPFTKNADGKWVITKQLEAGAKVKFIDENEDWYGGIADAGSNFPVIYDYIKSATPLTMSKNAVEGNFEFPVAGTWTFTVDMDANTVIISGDWYFNVAIARGIANGSVRADKSKALENETVTLTITPNNGFELDQLYYKMGNTQVNITSTSFKMPAGDVTIYATFKSTAVTLEGVEFTSERKWATWYDNQNLALPENVTAYVVEDIYNDVAQIRSIGYLPKNVGVLLYSETPASNVTALPYSGTTSSPYSLLEGSVNGMTISNDCYLLYNNCFVLAQNSTLAPHRCYLSPFQDAPAAPSILRIGGSTITAITNIDASNNGKIRYYDLNGREVNENATGILIRRNADGTVTKVIK